MNSLLLIGSEGYIGHYIVQFFESIGWTVHSTGLSESKRANYYALDITNQEAVARIINELRPQVIIQAAGLSSLALCEQEPERARAVNVEGTKNIIDAVRSLGDACKLVFLSSDYVFDGESGNYDEESERRPKTEYGRNKLASEVAIQDSLQNYIILRMSNVYGHGGNFYNFVNSNLAAGQSVDLFDDTHFTPVSIEYLARSLKTLLEKDFKGVLHIAGSECLSRYEFGLRVAEQLNVDAGLVRACGQPTDGLISKNNSLCIRKATQMLPLYNPPVIKALHILSGIFSYPHLYFADTRGLLHGITQGEIWAEMNYAESRADTVRGGHYHRKTLEGFYIIRGRVKVQYRPLKTGPEYCFIAERGDSFLVPLLTVHTFTVLEDSAWINYLSRAMDDEDKDIHRD